MLWSSRPDNPILRQMDPAQWDAFICHRGPDAKQNFASFLHYALDVQGIRAFFDHKMVGGTNPTANMETAMQTAVWGVIILSPRFFESKACMKELGVFLERGKVLPVALGLEVDDIDASKIAGKEGAVWGVHGGELWKACEMEEAAWRSLVDRVAREAVVVKSEDSNDYWGELINELVVNLARKLGRLVVESRVARSTVTPPYLRNLEFLGRDKELKELHEGLLKPQSRVSISSMGGMGKTQLALEYVFRHLGEYWKVLWVNGGSESLITNFLGLAEDLGVVLEKEKRGEVAEGSGQGGEGVALVRRGLERLRVPCLLVFDDVADERQLPDLLPRTGECRVLVTTRVNLVDNFHNIPLGRLSPDDGLSLIRDSPHPGAPEFEEGLRKLAERFDYLTLALSVCSAWLRKSRIEPAALLQRLDKKEVAFAFDGKEADPIFKKNPDLVALFQASIEQIKRVKGTATGNLAERIIWVGGWFAGAPIRVDLLASAVLVDDIDGSDDSSCGLCGLVCLSKQGDAQDVNNQARWRGVEAALDELVNFNLADRGSRNGTQHVILHTVLGSFGRIRGGFESARTVLRLLVEQGNAVVDFEHFQHACDLAFSTKVGRQVPLNAGDRQGAVSQILLPLVSLYQQQGLYFKARDAMSDANIGEMPSTIRGRFLDRWASSFHDCGQYEEALALFRHALHIFEKALGPKHLLVATTLQNMAPPLHSLGKYGEAFLLLERSLLIVKKALGPDHQEIATTLSNMADMLQSLGKYDEGLALYGQAVRILEKVLGVDHPSIAPTLNNMANLLKTQCDYNRARLLYLRALQIQEKALGQEHPVVVVILSNLAGLQTVTGRYEEALMLYQRALWIGEKALGLEHPNVVTIRQNLAIAQEQNSLEISRMVFGSIRSASHYDWHPLSKSLNI